MFTPCICAEFLFFENWISIFHRLYSALCGIGVWARFPSLYGRMVAWSTDSFANVNLLARWCRYECAHTLYTAHINYRVMITQHKLIFTDACRKAKFNICQNDLCECECAHVLDAPIFQIHLPIIPLEVEPYILWYGIWVNQIMQTCE